MSESRTHIILSDMHLVHQWDTPDDLARKKNAVECIAQTISEIKGQLEVILNGDILHRPDMPKTEGFDAKKAQATAAPMVEALADKDADVLYQEGNCDPWAGSEDFRYQLQSILDPNKKLRRLTFSNGAYEDEDMLITHGHILEVPRSIVAREALPLIKPVEGYIDLGKRLKRFLEEAEVDIGGERNNVKLYMRQMIEDRLEREWSGEHRKMHKIRKLINWVGLGKRGEEAYSRAYTKAFIYGNAMAHRASKLVSIGHTHLCVLHTRQELEELIGEEIFLPQAFLNTGTATGDRGKPATFGVVTEKCVKLMEVNSPSRQAAVVRKEVPLA